MEIKDLYCSMPVVVAGKSTTLHKENRYGVMSCCGAPLLNPIRHFSWCEHSEVACKGRKLMQCQAQGNSPVPGEAEIQESTSRSESEDSARGLTVSSVSDGAVRVRRATKDMK